MNSNELHEILELLRKGELSTDNAANRLKAGAFRDGSIDIAELDHHRTLRTGIPEAIFGESKTVEQIQKIVGHILETNPAPLLITRLSSEKIAHLTALYPQARVNATARTLTLNGIAPKAASEFLNQPFAAIAVAGTSDLPVAEEAAEVLATQGIPFTKLIDVGVAGLHRLLSKTDILRKASAVIVVAGMEGALASVVGGLVSAPVFAVPTSVGYGASFQGLSALLTMLNSCAPGVSVLNIDNGFGAGVAAAKVIKQMGNTR